MSHHRRGKPPNRLLLSITYSRYDTRRHFESCDQARTCQFDRPFVVATTTFVPRG